MRNRICLERNDKQGNIVKSILQGQKECQEQFKKQKKKKDDSVREMLVIKNNRH